MRSEEAKRKDHPHAETVQSRGVAMGLQQSHGAAHGARRAMIQNNIQMQGGVMKNILHSFVLFIVVTVASAVFTYPAHAGRYELIKGKGMEVCESYAKNLNSFKPVHPMICEREINPEMKDFQKPEWKEIDAWENRPLVRKINRFLGLGMAEDWEDSLKWDIEHRQLVVHLSQIDIDNDGQRENVLRFAEGS